MRALLDTHTFLWWIIDNPLLSVTARQFISDSKNELFLSAASVWEMVIKCQIGRLALPEKPETFIAGQMVVNSIQSLPVTINHALAVNNLPTHHRDPFDRMLIAQARIERMPLITNDQAIKRYDIESIW